jgi:Tol biopolymer transport system component
MMIMDLDGSNRQVISPTGWSVQMSPDGKKVAFYESSSIGGIRAGNLTVMDLATKRRKMILEGKQATRYRQVFWCFDWSPDSREICFRGSNRTTGAIELAIVNASGSDKGFQLLATGRDLSHDVAWHPDGRQLLISRGDEKYGDRSLFLIDRDAPQNQKLLPGQPRDQDTFGAEWTRDGKRVVFSSFASDENESP